MDQPRRCAVFLLVGICGLAFMNGLTLVSEFGFGYDHAKGMVPLFRLNAEANVPTLFSTLLLLTASWLAFQCSRVRRAAGLRWHRYWMAMAAILLFMTFDEAFSIHEQFDTYQGWTNGWVETTGVFDGPWVIVYGALVVVFGLVFLPFFLALPRKYKLIFGGAGALYVTGAIGFEMFGAAERSAVGETLLYEIINSIEELMEMSGVAITIVGLITYRQASGAETAG